MADPDRVLDDYDSPWKEALEQYFPAFCAFYFPLAYAGIAMVKLLDYRSPI